MVDRIKQLIEQLELAELEEELTDQAEVEAGEEQVTEAEQTPGLPEGSGQQPEVKSRKKGSKLLVIVVLLVLVLLILNK